MPLKYNTYRIGFNGNDETEFDVEPGTAESETAELMSLFEDFLAENPDIIFQEIDYIEQVEGDD